MLSSDVLCHKDHYAGRILLNRPKAFNALTTEMVQQISAALKEWEKDDSVHHILVTSSSEQAFCAGGDIRALYHWGKAQDYARQRDFLKAEYLLNAQIKYYPKPYLSLMDGLVMGGGVGLSLHGRHRIGSDKYLFAMPETGIGFMPDVGSTHFLPRLPYNVGAYLALTGKRLDVQEALMVGLVTHYFPSDRLPFLEEALIHTPNAYAFLQNLRSPQQIGAPPTALFTPENLSCLQKCFSCLHPIEIRSHLQRATREDKDTKMAAFAQEAQELLQRQAPLSVAVTCAQMRRGPYLTLQAALQLEWQLAARFYRQPDFYEGVRAVLLDKDHRPKWQHKAFEDISLEEIEAFFSSHVGESLSFPASESLLKSASSAA